MKRIRKFIKNLFSKAPTPREDIVQKNPAFNERLIENITQDFGITRNKINVVHVLNQAIENPSGHTNNTFVTTITGTGQKQRHKVYDSKSAHAGPLGRSSSSLSAWLRKKPDAYKESRIPGALANESLMTVEQMRRLASVPFRDFAAYLNTKTQSQPTPTEPFKWLIAGHSRGGAIGNYLASPSSKTITLSDGTVVMLKEMTQAQADKSPLLRTISIKRDGQSPITVTVQIDRIGFSSTTGPNLKRDFQHQAANTNLEFLATRDAGPYGLGMKPQNQRRTINPGENLFLHIPVNHPVVTKAEPGRITHMQIIMLTSYLQMRRLGYPINPEKYKIPYRDKSKTVLADIILCDGKPLSAESSLQDCVKTLQKLQESIKTDPVYTKNPKFHVNGHGQDDRRFLVMRANRYATALDERLALAQHAIENKKSESEVLDQLFAGDTSNESKKFQNFVQNCLSRNGLKDQHLKNKKNRDEFLLLKTAAILKDEHFTKELFNKIDSLFSGKKDELVAVGIKNKILKCLESLPVEVDAENAKRQLVRALPEHLKLSNATSAQREKLEKLKDFIALKDFIMTPLAVPENKNTHKLQAKEHKELSSSTKPTSVVPSSAESSSEYFDGDNLILEDSGEAPAVLPPMTASTISASPKVQKLTEPVAETSQDVQKLPVKAETTQKEKPSLVRSFSMTLLGALPKSAQSANLEKSASTLDKMVAILATLRA